jgi:hypothetical protein
MNIFYLAHDQEECARYHVDKHCVKMILEYNQLLSTAHRVLDGYPSVVISNAGRKTKKFLLADYTMDSVVYSATHVNHPSAVWVRQSKQNYDYLYNLCVKLMDEYTYRYGKVHSCVKLLDALRNAPRHIPDTEFTQPTPAMPDEYKVKGDSIQSYRNYYNGAKTRMFSWKKRETPGWIVVP